MRRGGRGRGRTCGFGCRRDGRPSTGRGGDRAPRFGCGGRLGFLHRGECRPGEAGGAGRGGADGGTGRGMHRCRSRGQAHLARHNRGHAGRRGGWPQRLLAGDRTGGGEFLRRDRPRDGLDGPGGGHGSGGNRSRGAAIDVVVDSDVVVGDVRDVGHVGDVDLTDVVVRGMIPGVVFLVRAQRHPADRAGGDCGADRDSGADADEGHQCRRIDRAIIIHPDLSRRPGPAALDLDPAAVMERGKAPGGVVDPGPAPGRDIGPVTLTVRNPVGRHGRIPDLAILWRLTPVSGADQIAAAGHRIDHLGRDPGRGDRRRTFGVQAFGQEGIALRRADDRLERVGSGHGGGLVGGNLDRHACAGELGRTVDDGDQCRLVGGADHDIVAALTADLNQPARRLDRPGFVGREVTQVQIDLALRSDALQPAGIEGGHVEFGARCHGDAAVRHFQLRFR